MKGFLSLIFLLNLSCPTFCQDIHSKKSDEQALRYLKEIEWPKAYSEQDTLLLNKILANEFQSIDASGTISNKRLEIDYIIAHKPSYSSFKFKITRLNIFENGTAVVSGVGLIKGRNGKGEYEMTYHSSNVFIKRNSKWQAINSHVSGIKQVQL